MPTKIIVLEATSIEIPNGSMTILLEIYCKIVVNNGHITKRVNGKSSLNIKSLKCLLFVLLNEEERMMYTKSKQKITYPDTLLNKCIISSLEDQETIDIKKYRKLYHTHKFNNIDKKTICHEYFRGLTFVLRYYLQSIPDWHWVYPFRYSPFFYDLYKHIDSFDEKCEFILNKPLLPFQQLLSILPPRSRGLLPRALQPLMDDSIMYPTEFKRDYEGKRSDHEAHIF